MGIVMSSDASSMESDCLKLGGIFTDHNNNGRCVVCLLYACTSIHIYSSVCLDVLLTEWMRVDTESLKTRLS